MRNLCVLLIVYLFFALAAFTAIAQSNYNALQVSNEPYYELTGDKTVPDMIFAGSDPFEVKELYGETFHLYGKPWQMDTATKGILIFPNAFIEIAEPGNFVICDGMLKWLDSIDNTSKISYKIDGVSGSKVLKVQWKNLKLRAGQTGNYVNMQIWLYQRDGMVEYRYGRSSVNNASGYNINTGPAVGISYSDTNFASFTEKIWIYGTPPNIQVDSAHSTYFPNISGVPGNGTVYRFIPKSSVSVGKVSADTHFCVYPNPAKDELTIKRAGKLNDACKIELYDLSGRKLNEYTLQNAQRELRISVNSVTAGNYILRCGVGDITESYQINVHH